MATTTSRSTKPSNGTAPRPSAARRRARSASPALDVLLSDATVGQSQRWIPGFAGVKATAKLATRPQKVIRRGAGLTAELARIATGRSEIAPAKGDRRFRDPAWSANPAFKRLCQAYLAAGGTLHDLLSDAELDWASERRMRFVVDNLIDALAPSNFPATNPTVLKAVLDTGGANLVKGTRQFVRDMSTPPRIPTMVDRSSFTVGGNLALTPGAVVMRTPVFDLIQYTPQTTKVREQPLLIVPPMINKFYVTDLAPDRSLIEYLVRSGQQVFAISWRNPDERAAGWSLDTYAGAVVEAFEATQTITCRRGPPAASRTRPASAARADGGPTRARPGRARGGAAG